VENISLLRDANVKNQPTTISNRIAIIEDFECRVRKVPEEWIKEKYYYYFDQVADYLTLCGFVLFDYFQNIMQVETSNASAFILGTPSKPISEQSIKIIQEKVAQGCSLLVRQRRRLHRLCSQV